MLAACSGVAARARRRAVSRAPGGATSTQRFVALSGRYDLTAAVGSFRGLFDGHYDTTIYYNTPSHFVPYLTDAEILARLRRMEITLAIGHEDAFLENNRQLSGSLGAKGIGHALHVWPGEAHKARDWRQMVPLYL